MRFFLVEHESFVHIFRSLPLEIFLRIMCAYLQLFELVLDEMERQFVLGGEQGLDLARSEAVAVVDRLGGYMFSGYLRHLPRMAGGWPFLDPAVVSLGAPGSGGAVINMGRWPHSARTGRPVLLHNAVWFAQLGEHAFASKTAVAAFAEELVRELWVPQMRTFIMQQLRRRLHEGGGNPGRPITMENIASCETTMAAWEAAPNARRCSNYVGGYNSAASAWLLPSQSSARSITSSPNSCRSSAVRRGGTPSQLRTQRSRSYFTSPLLSVDGINVEIWVAVVTGCFLAAGIEWVPDLVCGRLTSRSVVRLGGQAMVQPAPFGPPGSLRRAAREAEIKHERTVKDRTKATFLGKGDAKVLDHYQIAMNCLAEKIDDLLCHLMLMIMLTICASSETPEVAQGSRTFSAVAKRKDPGQLALVMVTRMMWFLYPTSFPWAKNSGGTAYDVMEMMKKIKHKGCSNCMLRKLG
ncbi:hypothetical protein RB213_000963 [Colletotrichum asianum]